MWPFNKADPLRQVDADFSVTGQIRPEDLAGIKARGYQSLICARPDGEDPGQPDFATIAQAAREIGLTAHHVPVTGTPDAAQVAAFRAAMAASPAPTLGWCRSGGRAETLHRLSQA